MAFNVLSGRPVNSHTIALAFSIAPDFSVGATSNPANYVVTGPGTPVVRVVREVAGQVNLLLRDPLEEGSYTVEVGPTVEATGGNLVNPAQDTAIANGIPYPLQLRYLSPTSLQVILGKSVLANSAAITTSNYTLTGPAGAVTVTLVTLLGTADQVTLKTSTTLPFGAYRLEVVGLTTSTGLPFEGFVVQEIQPSKKRISVGLSQFTGEVRAAPPEGPKPQEAHRLDESVSVVVERARYYDFQAPPDGALLRDNFRLEEGLTVPGGWQMVGMSLQQGGTGYAVSITESMSSRVEVVPSSQPITDSVHQVSLAETYQVRESLAILPELPGPLSESQRRLFGRPDGLVFFTPSLTNVANSTIQVDDVKACTKAYDSYAFPPQEDAKTGLFTYASTAPLSKIGTDVLLGGSRTRTGGVTFNLHNTEEDDVEPVVDLDASFLLTQTTDPERASLLNNPGWATFTPGIVPPKYVFKTLDNSSPLPAPIPGGGLYYVNPGIVHTLVESLTMTTTTAVGVADGLAQSELFDLSPGENVVQANVSETITLTEGAMAPLVGVNLTQTLTLVEGLVLA